MTTEHRVKDGTPKGVSAGSSSPCNGSGTEASTGLEVAARWTRGAEGEGLERLLKDRMGPFLRALEELPAKEAGRVDQALGTALAHWRKENELLHLGLVKEAVQARKLGGKQLGCAYGFVLLRIGQLARPHLCHGRMCSICLAPLYCARRDKLLEVLQRRMGIPYLVGTLTIRNPHHTALGMDLNLLVRATRGVLRRWSADGIIDGRIIAQEITFKRQGVPGHRFHPHLHLVLSLPPQEAQYHLMRDFLDSMLRKQFKDRMSLDYDPQVDLQLFEGTEEERIRTAKYLANNEDFRQTPCCFDNMKPEEYTAYIKAIQGRHLIEYGGCYGDARV